MLNKTQIAIFVICCLEQETWGGIEEVQFDVQPNLWVGPDQHMTIKLGAVFALCIRADRRLTAQYAVYKTLNAARDFGCCEITGIGAGTLTRQECEEVVKNHKIPAYIWRNGTTCANRGSAQPNTFQETHKFKPCCYGYKGEASIFNPMFKLFFKEVCNVSRLKQYSLLFCEKSELFCR